MSFQKNAQAGWGQGSIPQAQPVQAHAVPVSGAGSGGVSQYDGITRRDSTLGHEFLMRHHWPTGLADNMIRNLDRVPYRFMIIDNSGSMSCSDGNRLEMTRQGMKMLQCSRWAELVQALEFHAEFAEYCKAPTEFRLLNGYNPIVIGEEEDDGQTLTAFKAVLENGPRGMTPLCKQIREVAAKIRKMAPHLRASNQIVAVTVFTDGEASDGTLSRAMKDLEGLPVWTVVRLCTDEEAIVEYWNDIDGNVELEMDVLDDLAGECEEVMSNNDWITYGEPLHRFREFGTPRKEMDDLDSKLLSPDEMRKVLACVLGGKNTDYPNPQFDMPALIGVVNEKLSRQPTTYSTRHRRNRPWIDVSKLKKKYGPPGCTIM